MESGDSFLFDEQVISVTSQGREHSYTLIIEAIKRAVQAASKRKPTALTPAPTSEAQEPHLLGRVHDEQDDTRTVTTIRLEEESHLPHSAPLSNALASTSQILPASLGTVFISWRMSESGEEVAQLEPALQALNINVIIVRDLAGADLLSAVSRGMDLADLVVIMGTPTYGRATNGMFDTYKEMSYIFSQRKPFFLLKMLPEGVEQFKEPTTNMVLNLSSTAWHPW